jgi:signal transduction histidine kinase/CheY-like chemotaxis protein/predicted Ser/Thr protein kinase
MTVARVHIPGIELGEELGRGAFSTVYRGRGRVRDYAVKVPRWRARSEREFLAEAVALARVSDPGLPAVLEVGESDGVPYLVMELVEGESLAERLRHGPLGQAGTLKVARSLARALEAIHRRGLLHRDLKPRNILLDDVAGRVWLVDFGFVTAIEGPRAQAAGTVGYVAPEQLDGRGVLDGRVDLYALGCTLYQCLTGELPPAPDRRAPSPSELARELHRHGSSADTARIVSTLLEPNPDDRYPSARALGEDLDRVAGGRAALAESEPDPDGEGELDRMPLVGRDVELARLKRAWDAATEGRGGTLLVSGTPGSGKSRLARILAKEARDEGTGLVLSAKAEATDPRPFPLLADLFGDFLRRLRSQPSAVREPIEERLRQAAAGPLGPLVGAVSRPLARLLGVAGPAPAVRDVQGAFAESLAQFFVRLAQSSPSVLICVDDLHWADAVSREVLVRAAHQAPSVPLLIVATARTEELDGVALARFTRSLGRDRLAQLPLAPLSEADVSDLVRSYLGGGEVEAAVVQRVVALADGTPLGTLELVRSLLEHGALLPHWGTWRLEPAAAEHIALPLGTRRLIEERLAALPPATRGVLEQAAVLGSRVAAADLAATVGVDLSDLAAVLADLTRTGVVERSGRGVYAFVHDSIREALLRRLERDRFQDLNQRAAEVLDQRGDRSADVVYAVARHYAAGHVERAAERVYDANRLAATLAFDRFDNEASMRFFAAAARAAELAGFVPEEPFLRSQGEACLRVGALDESLAAFERALSVAPGSLARGRLLGRIAWVHQSRADADRAWPTLERAFAALGCRMPQEEARSGATTLAQWGRASLPSSLTAAGARLAPQERERLEILCDLHYQNARLGIEYGKPLRLVQSTLQVLDVAGRLGRSRGLARGQAMYGFVLTVLGRRERGRRYLERGRAMAQALEDPVTTAYCTQLQSTAACWAGDLDEAIALAEACLDEFGPWLDFSDYCMIAYNVHLIESVRGRNHRALAWIERASERIRRQGRPPEVFAIIQCAMEASLVAQGRTDEADRWTERLGLDARPAPAQGFYETVIAGPRARRFTDTGDLGEDFEDLVRSFESEGHDPKKAHLALGEYFIHVAHGRVHQCLRAEPKDRPRLVAALGRALADLRGAARIPLFQAHLALIEGYYAWLSGDRDSAEGSLREAERRADRETCPWVLYGVARARAHMLRADGRVEAAQERARVAALLAKEHRAVHRYRFIVEEFGVRLELPSSVYLQPSDAAGSRQNAPSSRHLHTLLQISRATTRELELEHQARAVLDELIQTLSAERGFLLFEHETSPELAVLAARTRRGEDAADMGAEPRAIVERVRRNGEPHFDVRREDVERIDREHSGRVISVPLFLRERVVGVVYLDRTELDPAFSRADGEFLQALANQIPVALELTRSLQEREQLEESLRQSQKMEAIGQLAGGLAHDFNNMLTAIEASVAMLLSQPGVGDDSGVELRVIREASERAASLTRQLLTFSRRQVLAPEPLDLNEIIEQLMSMLRRLIGDHIEIELDLARDLYPVKTDRAYFEQMIVNLAVNARDAMPGGGTLRLETRNTQVDGAHVERKAELAPGAYAQLRVSDTGEGMSEDVQAKVFEPFFTTKQRGSGTGLGLTTVYGFVKQSGGHVELISRVGKGTTFCLYLPKSAEERAQVSLPATVEGQELAQETVLLVEDEELIRKALQRILTHAGYEVYAAEGGKQALDVVRAHDGEIDVVVTDVLMPGMNGPRLAEQLAAIVPHVPVLFISGYTDGQLVSQGILKPGVSFLQKPFSSSTLRERIQELVRGSPTTPGAKTKAARVET